MRIDELPEDILRCILGLCDVYGVLSFGLTSKGSRSLAVDRLIWVDIVEQLRWSGFIYGESRASIACKSQPELVAVVKRLLLAPESWRSHLRPEAVDSQRQSIIPRVFHRRTPPSAPLPPITPKQVVSLGVPKEDPPLELTARLLDGGEYVFFQAATLYCWSVLHNRQIWSYQMPGPTWRLASPCVFGRSEEAAPGGAEANIVLCARSNQIPVENLLEIISLNLSTGIATTRLSAKNTSLMKIFSGTISGSVACVTFVDSLTADKVVVLVDWTAEKPFLSFKTAPSDTIALTPTHVLVLHHTPKKIHDAGGLRLRIVSIDALQRQSEWFAALRSPKIKDIENLPTLRVVPLDARSPPHWRSNNRPGIYGRVGAFRSPIQDGVYRIWIQRAGYDDNGIGMRAINIPVLPPGAHTYGSISYGGHTHHPLGNRVLRVDAPDERCSDATSMTPALAGIELPESPVSITGSLYGSVLTYCVLNAARIVSF
ncbi:F-box domain-containing protein [Mycena kentingensis (nom. inval.)]|nr:F-box domain-containing protein [Mycena kentingensis (nom. inval.)]